MDTSTETSPTFEQSGFSILFEMERERELAALATYGLYPPAPIDAENPWWSEVVSQYRPACAHTHVIESGFGTAYCAACPAKLRRNEATWEWEAIS